MILQVRELELQRGEQMHLRGLNLDVHSSDCVVIECPVLVLGTLFLHGLQGMVEHSRGQVLFLGQDLNGPLRQSRLLRLRRSMAMVYREAGLVSILNVRDNIALPLGYHFDISRRELAQEVTEMSHVLAIEDLLPLAPGQLNATQTRLVTLARALLQRPRLLLIDGAFEGISEEIRMRMSQTVERYRNRRPFGVVMTTRGHHFRLETHRFRLSDQGLIPYP